MTLRPALLRALLLLPALASAAPAARPPGQAAPPAKPAPKPAPKAAAKPEVGSPGALSVGGFVGYETADFSGLSLRLDGALPVRRLQRDVTLAVVGSIGYSRLTWAPGFGVEGTADVLKLVPAVRFTVPVAKALSVFADAGLGLARVSTDVELPPSFAAPDVSDSTVNAMLRLGAGAWYRAADRLDVGVLLELDPILGDFGFASTTRVSAGSQTTFLVQVGAQVRL